MQFFVPDAPKLDIAGDAPVLAAGGIGNGEQIVAAIAMGAQGGWLGTLWMGQRLTMMLE